MYSKLWFKYYYQMKNHSILFFATLIVAFGNESSLNTQTFQFTMIRDPSFPNITQHKAETVRNYDIVSQLKSHTGEKPMDTRTNYLSFVHPKLLHNQQFPNNITPLQTTNILQTTNNNQTFAAALKPPGHPNSIPNIVPKMINQPNQNISIKVNPPRAIPQNYQKAEQASETNNSKITSNSNDFSIQKPIGNNGPIDTSLWKGIPSSHHTQDKFKEHVDVNNQLKRAQHEGSKRIPNDFRTVQPDLDEAKQSLSYQMPIVSVILGVCVILTLVTIIGVGWMVLRRKKNTNRAYSDGSQVSSVPEEIQTPKICKGKRYEPQCDFIEMVEDGQMTND